MPLTIYTYTKKKLNYVPKPFKYKYIMTKMFIKLHFTL